MIFWIGQYNTRNVLIEAIKKRKLLMEVNMRNLITLRGTKEALEEVIAFLKAGYRPELDFGLLIPTPKNLYFSSFELFEGVALGEFLIDHTTKLMSKSLDDWVDWESGINTVRDAIKNKAKRVLHMGGALSDEELLTAFMDYYKRETPWMLKNAKQEYKNYKQYGYGTLDEWAQDHWSTPNNAFCADLLSSMKPVYDGKDRRYVMHYTFNTKDTPPVSVYSVMVKKFSDVKMEFEFADNKQGVNAGYIEVVSKTKVVTIHYMDESNDALSVAKKVFSFR